MKRDENKGLVQHIKLWAFTLSLLSLISGCGGFNPDDVVSSNTRPSDHSENGELWIATPKAGTVNEWVWIPWEADLVGHEHPEWPDGQSVEVYRDAKIWKVTRQSSGFEFGRAYSAEIATSPWLIAACIFLTLLALYLFVLSCDALLRLKDQDALRSEISSKKSELNKWHKEQREGFEQQREAIATERRKLEQEHQEMLLERQHLDQQKSALEQQEKAIVVAGRQSNVRRIRPPTGQELRRQGAIVRAGLLRGKCSSREISVEFAVDPQQSGAVYLVWEITLDRPHPPAVRILCDGRLIQATAGVFQGMTPHWLPDTGKPHGFTVELHDGDRKFPDPLFFEITLPPKPTAQQMPVYEPPKPKTMKTEHRRRVREIWIEKERIKAKLYEKDPKKLQIAFAKIDQEALEKFGEAP